jgi:hypothetical protein
MVAFTAFDRWLAEAGAARGLSCALLHDGIVNEAIRQLDEGRLTIGFHLDYFALWHVAQDPYARLAEAVQNAGGQPINPPARSRHFTNKAIAHEELVRHGLGVPETILVGADEPDRALTGAERAQLRLEEPGAQVYIKPANGFGCNGVMCVDGPEPERLTAALTAARNHDRQDTYLVQREVRCPWLKCTDGAERPAYWRVLYCLGEWMPFWWSKHEGGHTRPSYHRLTPADIRRHHLQPMLAYAEELALLSGLEWFSTELCLSEGPQESRFRVRGADGRQRPVVAIDYVNDQCDVDVQSRWPGAPPDEMVRQVAERFAETAWSYRQILPFSRGNRRYLRTAA